MHACPCCGFRTLPSRGEYDLCPVCWWEDEGLEPWEHSGPNHTTLLHAQQEFLADQRPYRDRPGRVRAPRRREARDPGWTPIPLTDELLARARRSVEAERRAWAEEEQRYAAEVEADPEGPFKAYNAGVGELAAVAGSMSHREVRRRLERLGEDHGLRLPRAFLDLQARTLTEPDYFRRRPLAAAWWWVRHARPGTVGHRWRMLRTGEVGIAWGVEP